MHQQSEAKKRPLFFARSFRHRQEQAAEEEDNSRAWRHEIFSLLFLTRDSLVTHDSSEILLYFFDLIMLLPCA